MTIGVVGLTTSEVSGFSGQKGTAIVYSGADHTINFTPK